MPRRLMFALSVVLALVVTVAVASAKTAHHSYSLTLKGSNEVPKGASGASAKATITLGGNSNQICWNFSALKGFSKPTAAHIHKGKAGTAGPIFVGLFSGKYASGGCVNATASAVAAIAKNPKNYYVNIHNAKYPGGAVRAQL